MHNNRIHESFGLVAGYMKRNIALLLLVLLMHPAFSQEEHIRFRHLDINDGLSSNSILSVCQDYRGFMWFGTRYGLNRFDGHDFRVYLKKESDPNTLSSNHINIVFEDSRHKLWIGTGTGINLFDRAADQFGAYEKDTLSLLSMYVKSIVEDNKGNIWIGGTEGVYSIDALSGDVESYSWATENTTSAGPELVNCLFLDDSDHLWIGTARGLFVLKNGIIEPYGLHMEEVMILHIRDIYQTVDGMLWLGTETTGVFSLDPETGRTNHYTSDTGNENRLISNIVRVVFEDRNGILWFGTRYGLSLFNPESGKYMNYSQNITDPSSLHHNSVFDIFCDDNNGIWVATYGGGLHYYHKENTVFRHIKQEIGTRNTLSYNRISYLHRDREGFLWIGTEGRGLNRYDERNQLFNHFSNSEEGRYVQLDNIKSISETEDGVLWLGTNGGLVQFQKKSEKFRNFFHMPADSNSLSNSIVHSTLIDSRGNLWIGTNGGGIDLYLPDKNAFKHFRASYDPRSITSNNVNILIEGHDRNIWVGTLTGMCEFNPVTQEFVTPIDTSGILGSGLNSQIISLYEDSRKWLWIGTEGNGIILYDKSRLTSFNYTTKDGLPGNIIFTFEEDSDSNIWISTNKGISRITANPFTTTVEPSFKSKNFNESDGLRDLEFSYRSSWKDKDGKLYFGGINGLYIVEPNQVSDTVYAPPVMFTDLKIKYKSMKVNEVDSPLQDDIGESDHIILNYDQSEISITFAGLNYINPDNLYYSYMLKGKDDHWVSIGDQRTLWFTYLEAGEYELLVRASDDPEIWEGNAASLLITVLPPPWKTWWAYLVYVLLVAVIIAAILTYSIRWFRLKNRLAIETFNKQKDEELHQMKIRFFTDVSHELRTPLTLILTPLEKIVSELKTGYRLKSQLSMIQRNGKTMLTLINQLLDVRKFETGHMKLQAAKGNISGFIHETTLPFREIARIREIDFKFSSSSEPIEAWYDRGKMEIVLNNLLSNAIKATPPGGKIEVRLSEDVQPPVGKLVEIVVEDYGKGIPPEILDRIFERFYTKVNIGLGTGVGLELTKRMVELHKGTIAVESKEASSEKSGHTSFIIRLPMGREHLQADQIVEDYRTSEDVTLYQKELLSTEEVEADFEEKDQKLDKILNIAEVRPVMVIVEDNREVCSFIRSLFIETFQVETSFNGKEGWNSIIKTIPDVIISDVMMPETDGLELCRMVKSDKRTCHIPIILLTARTSITFKYEGLETGADDYIHKPFSADYLQWRVKNLIRQRQLMQEHFYRSSLFKPEEIAVTSTDEIILRKAIHLIEEKIDDPDLNVDSLSKEIGLSRVHFYRKIKSLTNLTAVEFIRAIRMKKAAQLLEQGSLDVSEIRYMVGFQDAEYFRNSFRKQFKMTPSEYANKHTQL